MKSVFISFVYEDKKYRDQVEKWARDGLLGEVTVTGEKADVRQNGSGAIRRELSPMLEGAAAVLLLVGDDTHNHEWVDYEVNYALSRHQRVLVVRIPNTTGGVPKSARNLPESPFEPEAIRKALEG